MTDETGRAFGILIERRTIRMPPPAAHRTSHVARRASRVAAIIVVVGGGCDPSTTWSNRSR
ncbi:hypothetical protein [Streptomyces yunnanensis]|uniref:hypothetical protein n=1 Tax=Streptomyces yunnanensis TaxID=156453 RepID=UPI001160EA6F|nr:hypothetical protein [Streptomyces yunnanensis]